MFPLPPVYVITGSSNTEGRITMSAAAAAAANYRGRAVKKRCSEKEVLVKKCVQTARIC